MDLPERTPADGVVGACWQCEAAVAVQVALCVACGVVQPPLEGLGPFARLGLEPNARLTTADVATRRLELLDQLHPDRFAAHSPIAGQHAQTLAIAINDAARALRDPLDRLAEIFRLRGIEPEPVAPTRAFFTVLQEFQAALIELRGVDAHAERDRLGREVAHRFQATQDALAIGLETPDFPAVLARQALGELMALRGLIDQLEALDTTPDRLGRRRT